MLLYVGNRRNSEKRMLPSTQMMTWMSPSMLGCFTISTSLVHTTMTLTFFPRCNLFFFLTFYIFLNHFSFKFIPWSRRMILPICQCHASLAADFTETPSTIICVQSVSRTSHNRRRKVRLNGSHNRAMLYLSCPSWFAL